VAKRYLMAAAAHNLGRVLRKLFGLGKPKALQGESGLAALVRLLIDWLKARVEHFAHRSSRAGRRGGGLRGRERWRPRPAKGKLQRTARFCPKTALSRQGRGGHICDSRSSRPWRADQWRGCYSRMMNGI